MLRATLACLVLTVISTLAWADDRDSAEEVDSREVITRWMESLTELLNNTDPVSNDDAPQAIQYEVEPVTHFSFIASITNTTKTPDRHGLLRLRWDQQEIVNFKIFLAEDQFYVTEVSGYVQEKAPWGAWHREVEGVPKLYSQVVPNVGDVIALP